VANELRVPELGESVVEATVAEWLKAEGDAVKTGEAVVRLETDKVDVEVSAEHDGVLNKVLRQQGEDVRVGEVLATIEPAGAGETDSGRAPAQEQQPAVSLPAEGARGDGEGDRIPAGEATARAGREAAQAAGPAPSVESAPAPATDEGKISPLARRVAEELHVDVTQIPVGPSGRISREDVEAFASSQRAQPAARPAPPPATQAPPQPTAPPKPLTAAPARETTPTRALPGQATPGRPEERIRFSRRRQTIARRLVEAQQTAAMLTTFNEVDMSAVMAMRAKHKESFKERHGIGLGFMSFFVKASIGALKAFPQANAELQADELVLKHYYDIGIAIGAEEGLVVPVVRDADRMSFAQIEQAIEALAKKTRDGTLSIEDLRGGTFTITNGGVFGSLLSTPILNPPQVAILGMHKIEQRPIALNGEVAIRPMMYVALSYDHRVIDGREAVQFLVRLKTLVEDPEALLLEG
jgi:2-oxoglutarate dehydrogenase E2 component (dihydrolipoamide succinyltransferase)